MAESRTSWSKTVAILGIALLVLLGILGAILLFGRVEGEEISTANFSRRTFRYYRLPMVHLQLTPPVRTNVPKSPLVTHIAPLIRNGGTTKPRWDVTYQSTLAHPQHLGAAYLLTAYLDMTDADQKLEWLQWSQQYPELSDVLWPAVANAANDRQYDQIPEMMRAAQNAETAPELMETIRSIDSPPSQIDSPAL